jgi:hypothetical protein
MSPSGSAVRPWRNCTVHTTELHWDTGISLESSINKRDNVHVSSNGAGVDDKTGVLRDHVRCNGL